MPTPDQIMQVIDSSNYYEQISYLTLQTKRSSFDNSSLAFGSVPTTFLTPLPNIPIVAFPTLYNQEINEIYTNMITKNTMKQIGQIIDSSFLRPIILAPLRVILSYNDDNNFISYLISKIQSKESLVAIHIEPTSFLFPFAAYNYFKTIIQNYETNEFFANLIAKINPKEAFVAIHIEPTSFLRPFQIFNWFKSVIASSEMNDFMANLIAKINSVEKPLVAIHVELIPSFRTLIKTLPGKIRGLFVRVDFTNPKGVIQEDFDVDL